MPSRIHSFEKDAGTRFLPSEMGERVGEQERRREEGGGERGGGRLAWQWRTGWCERRHELVSWLVG